MIRAVDSTDYVVATNDESLIARVRGRFRDVRDSPDDLK
jgi:rRNA-processing protein FCF1